MPVRKLRLKHARIVAFSSTIKGANVAHPEEDGIMQALLEAETEHVTIVGKSWDLHVRDALKVTLDTNLKMVDRTVSYLKKHGKTVFFDAEHFFDGYKGQPGVCIKSREDGAGCGRRRCCTL